MTGPRVLLLGLLVVLPAFAGCASEEPEPAPVRPGSTSGAPTTSSSSGSSAPEPAPVRPRGTSERWHFHDYWEGNPTITLVEANLTFNATLGADGLPALSAVFELPHGVIVPPETGFLTFNATWPDDHPEGGVVNITYKPADSNDFWVGGDLSKGIPLVVNTTESNCDVPHRQSSAWKFNATAKPGGTPPALPPRDVTITITATIGRPLFIDPPHLNWWRDGEIIPIVEGAAGEIRAARTPAGNLTLPAGVPAPTTEPRAPSPDALTRATRVQVDAGRIVPEGTKSVVAMLNWTTQAPDAKLGLYFVENNYPSEGALELVSESAGARVYQLRVAQAQTDTTYSNRTTWEFRVVAEGERAAAFEGSFTLVAWASRLEPSATIAQVTAGA